ncbi:MAG: DUF885 family protein [Xanthomonadales bacterium]|nr:DUF885 family protein [Xanthomonadales bacterium]
MHSSLPALLSGALLATAATPLLAADDSEAFQALIDREWEFRTREFPGLGQRGAGATPVDRLTRVSEADQDRRYQFWKDIRSKLDELSCERLDRETCINFRIFASQMDQFIDDYETRAYLIPFNSDWSFWAGWGRMAEGSNFSREADYEAYLSRLSELPLVMDEYLALMRRGLELGMTQPRVILDGRDVSIRSQIVDSATDSPFYAPFRAFPERIPPERRAALAERARGIIDDGVIPAYRNLLTFFEQEYAPGARDTLGASDLPGGEAFYAAQIRRYVTLPMTPQEIHDIGLSEVARIRAEMDQIIKEVGFEGDFAAFLEFLRTDEQFYAKTPRELLALASYYAKKADGRLPSLFGHLPRQPYGVAPVPEEIAPFFTAGRYAGAPAEARRGGYYWVNTHQLESRTLYTLPALTLHEAVPGHHLQAALALEQAEQPPFRRNAYISAYGEGWALYAEKLGVEMDIYETPYEDFGRLTYEMWRACRLVIDTGVHAFGWSREQALDYLASNTALSLHEVTTEVDRYISWPGQALSYKLGEYTLWQLRRDAEDRLGEAFDLRDFHDFILGLGSVPLDILRDEVGRWVSEQEMS